MRSEKDSLHRRVRKHNGVCRAYRAPPSSTGPLATLLRSRSRAQLDAAVNRCRSLDPTGLSCTRPESPAFRPSKAVCQPGFVVGEPRPLTRRVYE